MKQEFVTLPREVVEQVLEALIYCEAPDSSSKDQRFQAAIALRAALEQPQGEQKPFAWINPRALEWGTRQSEKVVKLTCEAQPEYDFTEPLYTRPQPKPAMTPIAQRKLDSLLTEGYTISGYSIYHERKHQHGFVTGAGLVGWWKPEGVEYPQPQGEQDLQASAAYDMIDRYLRNNLHDDDYSEYSAALNSLYTNPQPKLEPLTDAEIGQAVRWFYQDHRAAEMGLEDDIAVARAIEAAHDIK